MIRILYVITDLLIGGAEVMLSKLLFRIDRSVFQPIVVSLGTMGELGHLITEMGIPVLALYIDSPIKASPALIKLLKIVRRYKPHLVHTWMYYADLLGGLAARIGGVRSVVWCIRNYNLDKDKTKFLTRTVARVCGLLSNLVPTCIVSCSRLAIDVHVSMGYSINKFVVIPNGFDLSLFKPDNEAKKKIRQQLRIDLNTPLVGMIARFDPHKNHLGFIEAAGMVHREMPDVHFLLAGNGVDENNLQLLKLIDSKGLRNVTYLLGLRRDVPQLMAALDLLVSFSHGEAFPNVVGEAMACGVPCIVTDVGDCSYIVGDTGRVVIPGDSNSLALAIKEVISLPLNIRMELGKRARARVKEEFSIENIVHRYEELYKEIIRNSTPKPMYSDRGFLYNKVRN